MSRKKTQPKKNVVPFMKQLKKLKQKQKTNR